MLAAEVLAQHLRTWRIPPPKDGLSSTSTTVCVGSDTCTLMRSRQTGGCQDPLR